MKGKADRRVSANLKNVPAREAVRYLAAQANLAVAIKGTALEERLYFSAAPIAALAPELAQFDWASGELARGAFDPEIIAPLQIERLDDGDRSPHDAVESLAADDDASGARAARRQS